jgi:hypothetical protein
MKNWYILWPFGKSYSNLVHLIYFVAIWNIFSTFGLLSQEKSCNPGCQSLGM